MNNNFIKEYKNRFSLVLNNIYEKDESEALFKLVIEHVFNTSYIKFTLENERQFEANEQKQLDEILKRLAQNEPVQHIFGIAHFYDLEFEVNPHVLIPRQETELLVHLLIEKYKQAENPLILDIGTGSGCIAISLQKNLSAAKVSALDISKKALDTAEKNACLNNVKINLIEDDILNPKEKYNTPFNLIVSNPPYVRVSEKASMHKNVADFDPELALFIQDDNPLVFYNAIADFAKNDLIKEGVLAFEINEAFGQDILELVLSKGFKSGEIIKDLNRKDRFVIAVKNE